MHGAVITYVVNLRPGVPDLRTSLPGRRSQFEWHWVRCCTEWAHWIACDFQFNCFLWPKTQTSHVRIKLAAFEYRRNIV